MEQDFKNAGDASSIMTSCEETVSRKPDKEEMMEYRSNINEKLHYYQSQCRRYNLQKIEIVQRCIREELDVQHCNLDHYGIGPLQCHKMFETFAMNIPTNLTSISLKNNQIEQIGCHAIASFMQASNSIMDLNIDGCKYGLK